MREYTEEQLHRYSRHILLEQVGIEGQERLLDGKVAIIGAGGLGAPAALYLAAAGVGTIGIIDGDRVELSNLQRQITHFTKDVGAWKAESAAEKMRAVNPDVRVNVIREFARADTIKELIRGYDFVLDGTDNFAAKFLINDACVMENIPFSHGGILRFDGQTMTVNPAEKTACYRCVFGGPPPKDLVPTCSQAGVLGAVAGMLGTIQATEALKFLTGVGTPLYNKLLTFNALNMNMRNVDLRHSSKCPVCGDTPTITTLRNIEQAACDLTGGSK
ncbi:MAG: HesA/MoeB/ThiF family protein [Fibrobacterota bacterium]